MTISGSTEAARRWVPLSGKLRRFQSIRRMDRTSPLRSPCRRGAPNLITDLTRGSSTRITFRIGNNYKPVWSPDGKRVAYQVDRDGKARPTR